MLKIFLKFGKLSCSFFHICSSSWREGPRVSLAFMIKAHSSQNCRRIRILSVKLWNVMQISQRMSDWLISNLQIIRCRNAFAISIRFNYDWFLVPACSFWGFARWPYKHVPLILTMLFFPLHIIKG